MTRAFCRAGAILAGVLVAVGSGVVSAGPATSLVVSVTPDTLSCGGGASFVTVVAHDSSGATVPAGTVFLTTDLGTISPASDTDDNGAGIVAVLTAPASGSGIATVTATTGSGLIGTATATVVCRDSCRHGGWKTLTRADGSTFKNQGDCTQYVNSGK